MSSAKPKYTTTQPAVSTISIVRATKLVPIDKQTITPLSALIIGVVIISLQALKTPRVPKFLKF